MIKNSLSAVIVAGGIGSRMKADIPKQFIKINGKEIILYTIETFLKCNIFDKITVVCHSDYVPMLKSMISHYNTNIINVVSGGKTRQESVRIGLDTVSDTKYVLIHDAVRCCIDTEDILKISEEVKNGSCSFGIRINDTVKVSDENNYVLKTVDRNGLWRIQTPQAFETRLITDAHKAAENDGVVLTDDCSAAEYCGINVKIIEGKNKNIKITTKSDISLAKFYLNGCE